ncbi:MAG TPA: hypothetical protein VGT02_03360 [Methylomirabilota bacterium]|jgi:hypothetical protein|nr:hypothetical protein [Methylomirabilota bacterium]
MLDGPDTTIPGTLPRRLVAAVPNFVLAGTFVVTWVSPPALGERMVAYLVLVMLVELVTVHSSGLLMGFAVSDFERAVKVPVVAGLALVYTALLGGFSLAFGTWWPLVTFWLLTANRLLGPLLAGRARSESEKTYVYFGWGFGAVAYLVSAGVTTMLPVPRLGVTRAVVAAQELPGEGLWVDEPHRALAFGVLYFTVVGLWELSPWAKPAPGASRGGQPEAA